MTKELKIRLVLYGIITSLSFFFFITVSTPSASVPVFAAIQLVCLYLCVPDKKQLIKFIPIAILCLNPLISASTLWHKSNFAICVLLYICMFTEFRFRDISCRFATDILNRFFAAFDKIHLPFKWLAEFQEEKTSVIKKFTFATFCSTVCAVALILVLSGADMVFDTKTWKLIESLQSVSNISDGFFILLSVGAGLYLFGIVCTSYSIPRPRFKSEHKPQGDLILINTILFTALAIYTFFSVIQFKYLFAGSTLPYGLSYAAYARQGFFELLGLSFVNIAAIIAVIYFIRPIQNRWAHFSRLLCCYLCVITMILLASSFYRLNLYTNVYGLTRLRLFVMGFLVFEALGLVITFVYIVKPTFNIVLIYGAIALSYYVILNIVPVDYIIAENHTSDYLKNGTPIPEYVFYELSADASPAMEELFRNTNNPKLKKQITRFLEKASYTPSDASWKSYNLSVERCKRLYDSLY